MRHSSLDASVMSALLNFVLDQVKPLIFNREMMSCHPPVNGRIRFLREDCDGRLECMLVKVRFLLDLASRYTRLASLRLSVA